MKILVVADVLGKKNNGTTMATYNLIESLQKRGHDVRVLCGDSDKKDVAGYFVCPNVNFGVFNSYVQKNGINPCKADENIIRKALEGVDLVHCMLPFFVGVKTAKIADSMNIPITCGFHIQAENVTSHFKAMKATNLNPSIYKFFFDHLYKYADCIHFPTKFIKDDFEKAVGPTNGYVISNGVKEFFKKEHHEKPDALKDKFCILFTGRYSREKMPKLLIDAAKYSKYKDKIQIILAGDGPLRKEVEKWSKKLPNPPILGIHSQDELLKIINYCDLYVHCAYAELESIACLEALSCGLVPIINNTKRSATKNFALSEHNLFESNNPKDLAKKIDYWYEHPTEREECSNQYVEYAKHFAYEKCMDRMNDMMFDAVKIRKYKVDHNLHNRVILYNDPINDDFACTEIKNKKIEKDFIYVHKNIFWRFFSHTIYCSIARPICYLMAKFSRHVKVYNKHVVKKLKKTGYFIYGNHTSIYDGFLPQACVTNCRKTYMIAGSDAVSIPGIKNLVMMLGCLPIPVTADKMKEFNEAIDYRISQKRIVAIYPEAHIWPYAGVVRPFKDVSFIYPSRLDKPIIAMAITYRPQKHNSPRKYKPKVNITLSEPIYPDKNLSIKENMVYLRDQVYDFLKKEVEKNPPIDYITYLPKFSSSTKFEKQ